MKDIQVTLNEYKQYYKVEKLEMQLSKLDSLVKQSAKAENSIKYKYKKLKREYKEKWEEVERLMDVVMHFQTESVGTNERQKGFQMGKKLFLTLDEFRAKIKKLENEREQARFYAKEIEQELKQTKEDLRENQFNLIEPLKKRLYELESIIQEKEHRVKRSYKKRLRRWRKELENEKKINLSLAKRIRLYRPNDRSISDIDLEDHFDPLSKYASKKQSKSQLEIGPSRQFNQFQTHIDLRRYKETNTIETLASDGPFHSKHSNKRKNHASTNPQNRQKNPLNRQNLHHSSQDSHSKPSNFRTANPGGGKKAKLRDMTNFYSALMNKK
jgi:hypothetical protein